MRSSLVGSEMCIRDSTHTHTHTHTSDDDGQNQTKPQPPPSSVPTPILIILHRAPTKRGSRPLSKSQVIGTHLHDIIAFYLDKYAALLLFSSRKIHPGAGIELTKNAGSAMKKTHSRNRFGLHKNVFNRRSQDRPQVKRLVCRTGFANLIL